MDFKDKDPTKLCLIRVPSNVSNGTIREICNRYGHVCEFKPVQNHIFITFNNSSEAENAKKALTAHGLNAEYANIRNKSNMSLESSNTFASNNRVENTSKRFNASLNLSGNNDKNSNKSAISSSKTEDVSDEIITGECTKCLNIAHTKCGRCGDFYCSIECQTADWKRHRPICFPMPDLISAKCANVSSSCRTTPLKQNEFDMISPPRNHIKNREIVQSTPKERNVVSRSNSQNSLKTPTKVDVTSHSDNSSQTCPMSQPAVTSPITANKTVVDTQKKPLAIEEIKNHSKVYITYVCNQSSVYVRLIDSNNEYINFLKSVDDSANTSANLSEFPNRENIVLAPFEGNYYRALVISANNSDAIRLAFLDFGNVESIPFNKLKELSADLKFKKRFAVKLTLDSVSSDTKYSDGIKVLKALEGNLTPILVKCDGTVSKDSKVTLIDLSTKENVNQKIMGNLSFHSNEIEIKKLDKNCKKIIVINTSLLNYSVITCIDSKDKIVFASNNSKLTEYCKDLSDEPPFTPKENELCLVRISEDNGETEWYRSECIKAAGTAGGKSRIILLDYGRTHDANIEDIRRISKNCLYPSVSVLCTIHGAISENDKVPEKLLQHLRISLPLFEEVDVDDVDPTGDDCVIVMNKLLNSFKQ